jgi:hypothetical protein
MNYPFQQTFKSKFIEKYVNIEQIEAKQICIYKKYFKLIDTNSAQNEIIIEKRAK